LASARAEKRERAAEEPVVLLSAELEVTGQGRHYFVGANRRCLRCRDASLGLGGLPTFPPFADNSVD
jgi:hypothetical protein